MRYRSNATPMTRLRIAAARVLVIASLCLSGAAPAKILDPGITGPESTILTAVADALDHSGVDVVLGQAGAFPTSKRPRLAPLAGFVPDKKDWGTLAPGSWSYSFKKGLMGALVAIQGPPLLAAARTQCEQEPQADREPCEFVKAWLGASEERRMFVAFTRDDVAAALLVKEALEQRGYVVFLFLHDRTGVPWADPRMVGEVFAQARHRLVIDTSNARASAGVAIERECCEWALVGPDPTTRWAAQLKKPDL